MEEKYKKWIEEYQANNDIFSKCAQLSKLMKEAFPELKCIRGEVFISPALMLREHIWCETVDGVVVDPTASQYATDYYGNSKIVDYMPRDESVPEPQGKCVNCGEYCYPPITHLCSEECHSICNGLPEYGNCGPWVEPYKTKTEAIKHGYGNSEEFDQGKLPDNFYLFENMEAAN